MTDDQRSAEPDQRVVAEESSEHRWGPALDWILRDPAVALGMRLVLAAVLLQAGGSKLLEPDGARTAILAYRLLPVPIVDVLAWVLPAVEVGIALLLLAGILVRWAGLATGLLMIAFVIGIISVWVRGYSIDCGCFGGGGDVDPEGRHWRYTQVLLRDLLLAGMAFRLWVWPRSHLALERSGRGEGRAMRQDREQQGVIADVGRQAHGDDA
jgi:uncharacterized membrane protein YphA (DoxX/SURF4 family)